MTRAALLPAGADPFLAAYWLRHYRTWADEVDELRVITCGDVPDEVTDYTRAWVESVPHATMTHIPERTWHGGVIGLLMEQTSADHVLLIEDDAFVRQPGVIDATFREIESGENDVVGCPRGGYGTENLYSIVRRKFGDEPQGLALWPCFLFAPRAALEATDRHYGGVNFQAGDVVFGEVLTEPADADTFVWASLQLRAQGLRIGLRDGHRMGERAIASDAPWFHVGGLSSGHGYIWQSEQEPDVAAREYEAERAIWTRLPRGEGAKRIAWWQRAWDHWDGGLPEYHEAYGVGLRQVMADFGISQDAVNDQRSQSDSLLTWAES